MVVLPKFLYLFSVYLYLFRFHFLSLWTLLFLHLVGSVSTPACVKHTFRGLDAMAVCPYQTLSFNTGQLTYEYCIGGIITFSQ